MADKYISGIFYQVRFRNITEGTRIRFYAGSKSPNGEDYVFAPLANGKANLSGSTYLDIVAGPNITEYNLQINDAEQEALNFAHVEDEDDYYNIIKNRIYGCFRITSNSAVNITYETKKENIKPGPEFTIIKTNLKDIACAQLLENRDLDSWETNKSSVGIQPILANNEFTNICPSDLRGKKLIKFYTLRFEANYLKPNDAELAASSRQGYNNTLLNNTADNKNYYTHDYNEDTDYQINIDGQIIDLLNPRYYEVHNLSGVNALSIGAAITATWSCRISEPD